MHFRSFVVIVITCVCIPPSSTLRMKRQPESSTVAPGESVTLRCSISRPFAVDVFWKRVDRMLYLSRNTFVEPQEGLNLTSWKERYTIVGNQNKGQYFLKIDNFMVDDVGSYACEYYSSGSVKSRVADLRIATPPDAMYPICSISPRGPHEVGDVITLSCDSIGGDPPASLAFRRGSETLRIYLPFSGHPHSLVTHTFILEESDVNRRYTCVLRHPALANPRACSLMPLRTRVGAYLRPLVGKVMEGEDVTFTCVAERLPDLQFNWFIDGELVDGTDRFRQVDSSGQRLLISNTGMDLDYSLVTCEVIQIGPGHMGVATSLISVGKRPPTTTVPTTIHLSRLNNGNRALDTDVDSGDYVGSGGLGSDSAILPSDTDNIFHDATDSHVTTEESAPDDVVTPNVTGSYSTASSVREDSTSVQSDIVKDKSQDVTMDNQLSGNNKTNEEKPISHAQLDFNEIILPEKVADQNTVTNPPVTTETASKVFESSSEGSSLRDSVSSNKQYLETTDAPLVKSTEETLEPATTDRTIRESTPVTSKSLSSSSPSSSSISSSSTSNDVVTQQDSTKSYQSTQRPSKEMIIVFNVTIVKSVNETSASTKPPPKVQQRQSSTTSVTPSVKHEKEQTSTVSVTPSVTSDKERRSTTTLTPTVTNYKPQSTTNDLSSSFENEKEKQTTTEVTPSITSDKRRPSTTVMTPSMKQEKEQYTTKAVVTPSVTSSTEASTTTTMRQSVTSDKEQTSITVTTPSLASEEEQTVSPEAKDSGKQDPTAILTPTLKSEKDRSPTTIFPTSTKLIESSTISTRNVPNVNEASTVNTEVTSTGVPRRHTTGSLTTEPTADGTSKVIERTTVRVTRGPQTTNFDYRNDSITSTTQTTQSRQNTLKLSTESENNVTVVPATHKTTVKSHEMQDETTSNNPQRMTPVVDMTPKATSDLGSDDKKTSGYDSTLMTSTSSVEASVNTSTKATAVVADSNENVTTVGSALNDTFDISGRNNDSESEVPNDTNIGKNPNIFINLSESHSSVRYMDDRIWHYIIIGTAVIVVCIVAAVVVSAIVVSKRKGKT